MKKFTILMMTFIFFSVFTYVGVPQNTEASSQRFVLSVYSECDKALVTWENVPYAENYEIFRADTLIKTVDSSKTIFMETGLTEGEHGYQVVARLENGDSISSINTNTTVRCFGQNECGTEMKFVLNEQYYWVNDLKKGPMPLAPLITQDRTFLVIRYITDELGADISWDGTLRKVTIVTFRGKVIELIIGNNTAVVDGKEILIDPEDETVVPVIHSGRTLLPLRFVADQMGADDIVWNNDEKSITLKFHNESVCIKQKVLLNAKNLEDGVLFATDDYGNKFQIITDEDNNFSGSRILLDGTLNNLTDENVAVFGSISITPIQKATKVVGRVEDSKIAANRGILSLDDCDEIKEYSFTPGLYGLENISKGSFVKIESNEDGYISDWSYITNEAHCGPEPLTMNQNLVSKNEGGIWTTENSNNREYPEIFYGTDEWNFDRLDFENTCYEITYQKNWLGRNVCTGVSEAECSCDIGVTPITPTDVTLYKDVKYEFKLKIKNFEKKVRKISLDVDPGIIEGRIKMIPTKVEINPGEEVEIILSILIEEKHQGAEKLDYYIFCEDKTIVNSMYIKVISGSARYELEVPEQFVLNNNTRYVQIPFYITNDSFGTIFIRTVINSSTSITNHKVSPEFTTIQPHEKFKFIATGEMKFGRVMGQKINLFISTRINGENTTEEIPIYVDHTGRPTVDVWCESEDDGTVTLDGVIDWDTFTKESIVVYWGNNETEIIDKFPVTHKYESSGVHPISVTARTKDAEVFSTALGFGFCMAYVQKEPKDFLDSLELIVDENNPTSCRIEGRISKSMFTSRIRSVQINWGDGLITSIKPELSGEFDKEYEYQQHVRYKGDKEYLLYLTFLESIDDEADSRLIHVEKRRLTIKGSQN